MTGLPRPLSGFYVGVSISESEGSVQLGFSRTAVNRVTVLIVEGLLGQGAGAVFGHDWREDGVMETIHGFARSVSFPSASQGYSQPLIQNFLPWPDHPRLDKSERQMLENTLLIKEAGLPAELSHLANDRGSGVAQYPYDYLRARGLTHLRRVLNSATDARICLGGRVSSFGGRYPGIVEEAYIAAQSRKPLYLAGAVLGGATSLVVDAIRGNALPERIPPQPGVIESYDRFGSAERATDPDMSIDLPDVWETFRRIGVSGVSELNGLDEAANLELFATRSMDRVLELTLAGLGNVSRA